MSFKTALLLIFSIFSPYISQIFSIFSPLFSPTVKYMNPIFPLHLPLLLLLLSPIFNCFSSFLTYSTLLFVLEFQLILYFQSFLLPFVYSVCLATVPLSISLSPYSSSNLPHNLPCPSLVELYEYIQNTNPFGLRKFIFGVGG